MKNNLCLWCKEIYNDETKCSDVCEKNDYNLLDFISDNLPKDLSKEISYKRNNINKIKNLKGKNNFLATKRNYDNYLRINKINKEEIIYLIILLIIAICFGLYCIYYYFIIK